MAEVRKIVNRRINELRETLGLSQPEFAKKLGLDEKKGRSTVNNWETGNIQVKSDDLILISEKCNVSTDWLLGRETKPSLVEAIANASELTGLSKEAIKVLNLINRSEINESKRTTNFLNMALGDPRLKVQKRFDSDFPIETLFSIFDQYITAGSVKLSRTLQEDERFRHIITFESSNDMSEATTVADIYRQFKLNQIRDGLEQLQDQYFGKENNK